MSLETISSQKKGFGSSAPPGCMALFFLVFLVAGAAIFWFLSARPVSKVIAAQTWPPVACTVIESRVGESTSEDGTTYKVVVTSAYSYQGREYGAARYDFTNFYSSGYEGKAEVVARHPVGSRAECYVNPEDPSEAVLSRSPSARYLVGLFGLLFMLPGLFGVIWVLRGAAGRRNGGVAIRGIGGRKEAYTVADPESPFGVTNPQGDVSGPVELKPQLSPLGKLLGLLFGALFWNGIVGGIAYLFFRGSEGERADGCLIVFFALFGLVGLLLIYAFLRQVLVLFNPRPKLTLSPGTLKPGGTAYVQWRLAGGTGGVRRLEVWLEGTEEARYRRGTDTATDRNTFAVVPIVDSNQEYQMATGSTSFTLPADTMPSFTAENNRIVWTIKAKLEISGWPDSEEEFEILVRP